MKIKNYFVVVVFLLGLIFLTVTQSTSREGEVTSLAPQLEYSDIKYVKIAGQNIKVELALTPEEMSRGLSGRDTLAEDAGMLFVFDQPGRYSFWMKDMNFPIDIIWLAPTPFVAKMSEEDIAQSASPQKVWGLEENGEIIYIKKDARPESFPETFGPGEDKPDAKYVLEVVSGFAEKHNLQEGDKVEFLYQQ